MRSQFQIVTKIDYVFLVFRSIEKKKLLSQIDVNKIENYIKCKCDAAKAYQNHTAYVNNR